MATANIAAVWTRAKMRNAVPVYLLDLTFGGRQFHVATRTVVVSSNDGARPYDGGLDDPAFAEAMDILSTSLPEASASIGCLLPVDVPHLVAQGHDPAQGSAALSMIAMRDGVALHTYEQRIPLIAGDITDPEIGRPSAPVGWFEATLRSRVFDDSRPFIPADARISDTTWASHNTAHTGKVYPWVFGKPGQYKSESGVGSGTSGSPGYILESSGTSATKLLLAGHRVRASTVTVFDSTTNDTSMPVTHEDDGLGRQCAVVDISAAASIDRTETEFWFGYPGDGGYVNPFRNAAELELVGDLCRLLLVAPGFDVDHGRWAVAASAVLNLFKVAFYANDPEATAWDIIADHLLPLVPMTLFRGGGGVYPVVADPFAAPRRAIASVTGGLVDVGRDWTRTSGLTWQGSRDDVSNEFSIEFAFRQKTKEAKRRWFLTPDRDSTDPEQVTSALVKLSRARYGKRPAPAMTSEVVYDDTTALAVLNLRAALDGFLPRMVGYAAPFHWGWLQVGDYVSITDADLHWSGQMAQVAERELVDSVWSFGLLARDNVIRDARATA